MQKKLKLLFSLRRIFGIYLLLFGFLIIFNIIFPNVLNKLVVLCIIVLVFSVDITTRALLSVRSKYRSMSIIGLSLATASIFSIILIFCKWDIQVWWPLYGVCPSFALIVYYCVMRKKSYSVLIPGIFILIMSGLILLFTTRIITLNKKYFFIIFAAILLIVSGVIMILPHSTQKNEIAENENNNEK